MLIDPFGNVRETISLNEALGKASRFKAYPFELGADMLILKADEAIAEVLRRKVEVRSDPGNTASTIVKKKVKELETEMQFSHFRFLLEEITDFYSTEEDSTQGEETRYLRGSLTLKCDELRIALRIQFRTFLNVLDEVKFTVYE